MDENKTDAVEVPETPQDAPEEVPETPQEPEVDLTELQAQLEESERKRNQLYERLKKAESQPKAEPKPTADPTQLGPKDYLALQTAGITADDFDEVNNYAKYRNIPIHEAVKDTTLQTILANAAEERKTAQATQTKSPRGIKPDSADAILRKAERGEGFPDTEAGIEKLVQARIERRRKRP